MNANIEILSGMSGHADRNGLTNWIRKSFDPEKTKKVFVVHGDDRVTESFAELLHKEYGYDAYAPFSGTKYDLINAEFIAETKGVPVQKKTIIHTRISTVFERLLSAAERLLGVAKKYEHGANKDIARFADQINALSDKWEK